jgi:hypothetical protein
MSDPKSLSAEELSKAKVYRGGLLVIHGTASISVNTGHGWIEDEAMAHRLAATLDAARQQCVFCGGQHPLATYQPAPEPTAAPAICHDCGGDGWHDPQCQASRPAALPTDAVIQYAVVRGIAAERQRIGALLRTQVGRVVSAEWCDPIVFAKQAQPTPSAAPDPLILADAMRFGYAWTGVPFPDQWPVVAAAVVREYQRQLAAIVALASEEPTDG